MRVAVGITVACLQLLGASATLGQAPRSETELEAQTRAVASRLRCVVCQGLSVQDSPSELAQDMKAVIREQLAAGRTPEEVQEYFVSKYGEWVLLDPKPEGFNLVVHLVPLLALLGGLALLMVVVRRWIHASEPGTREPGPR